MTLTLLPSFSPDLRDKFIRTELELFKQRFDSDDQHERSQFLKSLNFDWTVVDDTEKRVYEKQLKACMPWSAQRDGQFASESWVKVCHTCANLNIVGDGCNGLTLLALGAMVYGA
jgi:hypothetical protein